MGQRDVRRLLVIGAMSVISDAERKGRCDDPWLANMLKRQPRTQLSPGASTPAYVVVVFGGNWVKRPSPESE